MYTAQVHLVRGTFSSRYTALVLQISPVTIFFAYFSSKTVQQLVPLPLKCIVQSKEVSSASGMYFTTAFIGREQNVST